MRISKIYEFIFFEINSFKKSIIQLNDLNSFCIISNKSFLEILYLLTNNLKTWNYLRIEYKNCLTLLNYFKFISTLKINNQKIKNWKNLYQNDLSGIIYSI